MGRGWGETHPPKTTLTPCEGTGGVLGVASFSLPPPPLPFALEISTIRFKDIHRPLFARTAPRGDAYRTHCERKARFPETIDSNLFFFYHHYYYYHPLSRNRCEIALCTPTNCSVLGTSKESEMGCFQFEKKAPAFSQPIYFLIILKVGLCDDANLRQ